MDIDEKAIGTPPNVAFATMREMEQLRNELDEQKNANAELVRDAERWRDEFNEADAEIIELRRTITERGKLIAERNYYRNQLKACLASARGGAESINIDGFMQYPRPDAFAEPSLLVADTIVSLRDFHADDQRLIEKLAVERDEWKRKAEARSAKRAAAVERLRGLGEHVMASSIQWALFCPERDNMPPNELRDALIDLLADGETNGIHADAPLADRDPVVIMRKVANGDEVTGNAMRKEIGGTDWADALLILADMVERDYVRKDKAADYILSIAPTVSSTQAEDMAAGAVLKSRLSDIAIAERDELKAFSERLETAAHDKLGVTLFGVDYVTEEFMLHVRDTLTAERDELTNAVNELQKKHPYCYDPEKPLDTLNTIGRYIDELTDEVERQRKVIKAQAESFRKLEADGCSCQEVIEHLEDGITVGASIDGIEYVRADMANATTNGLSMPKRVEWPRYEDGKLVKISHRQAREIIFLRDGGYVHWFGDRASTTFVYGERIAR
jgi:hypothetical protein